MPPDTEYQNDAGGDGGAAAICVTISIMDARTRELLASYPRSRPPLSEAHRARYLLDYRQNRDGSTAATSLARRMEAWMHRRVAARGEAGGTILELGAGTLNHVPYESGWARYDVVEPFAELWQGSPLVERIANRYRSVFEVPAGARYDRVFSIAVLEHLTDLPAVLARCAELLGPGGIFQAGIPTEGGLLWGLGWRCVTGPAYRLRTGLDYASLMRHEHVNRAREIVALVGHFFGGVKVARYPAPMHHASFYSYLEASRGSTA